MGHSIKYIGHFVLLTSYQYVIFSTPLDAIFANYPIGYLIAPYWISFPPFGYQIFYIFKKNSMS